MITRRTLLFGSSAAILTGAAMTPRERVDRVLAGQEVDRTPFTFYYHFGLEKQPGDRHAKATIEWHWKFRTDLVKVMSDYPYPPGSGAQWHELEVEPNPYPEQITALTIINKTLNGKAHFIETIFNPWNVAGKLSSPARVKRMMEKDPARLLNLLGVIARSQANHARRAMAAGASGIFLAIANASPAVMSKEAYRRFSEPFDQQVLKAAAGAPLNTLHIHGEDVYLDLFYEGWNASVLQYDAHGTGIPIADVRRQYGGVILGGLDHHNLRNLTPAQIEEQWKNARAAAGPKFILAPGCSAPQDATDEELMRIVKVLGA